MDKQHDVKKWIEEELIPMLKEGDPIPTFVIAKEPIDIKEHRLEAARYSYPVTCAPASLVKKALQEQLNDKIESDKVLAEKFIEESEYAEEFFVTGGLYLSKEAVLSIMANFLNWKYVAPREAESRPFVVFHHVSRKTEGALKGGLPATHFIIDKEGNVIDPHESMGLTPQQVDELPESARISKPFILQNHRTDPGYEVVDKPKHKGHERPYKYHK